MIDLAKEEHTGCERPAMLIAYFIEKIWCASWVKNMYDKHPGSCFYLIKYRREMMGFT